MLKQIFDGASQVLTLTHDVQQCRADIKEVRQDIKATEEQIQSLRDEVTALRHQMNTVMLTVSHELKDIRKENAHERELLRLQLESTLVKFEHRLPPAPPKENTSSE